MPAVQLEKIRAESASLVQKFNQPAIFRSNLLDMFEYYSDRTFRASPVTLPDKLFTSYHVPERMLWQIKNDLAVKVDQSSQEDALDCAQLLWEGNSIEEKSLAVFILGWTTSTPSGPILNCLQRWYQPDLDPILRKMLVSDGLRGIRKEHIDQWVQLIKSWIESDDTRQTAQALQAITGLLAEEGGRHLPSIFRLVETHFFDLPSDIQPETIQLIDAMLKTSPMEVKFLLRQLIREAPLQDTSSKRLLRKLIDICPPEIRSELRSDFLAHYRKE